MKHLVQTVNLSHIKRCECVLSVLYYFCFASFVRSFVCVCVYAIDHLNFEIPMDFNVECTQSAARLTLQVS